MNKRGIFGFLALGILLISAMSFAAVINAQEELTPEDIKELEATVQARIRARNPYCWDQPFGAKGCSCDEYPEICRNAFIEISEKAKARKEKAVPEEIPKEEEEIEKLTYQHWVFTFYFDERYARDLGRLSKEIAAQELKKFERPMSVVCIFSKDKGNCVTPSLNLLEPAVSDCTANAVLGISLKEKRLLGIFGKRIVVEIDDCFWPDWSGQCSAITLGRCTGKGNTNSKIIEELLEVPKFTEPTLAEGEIKIPLYLSGEPDPKVLRLKWKAEKIKMISYEEVPERSLSYFAALYKPEEVEEKIVKKKAEEEKGMMAKATDFWKSTEKKPLLGFPFRLVGTVRNPVQTVLHPFKALKGIFLPEEEKEAIEKEEEKGVPWVTLVRQS